jgi:hypothetical protein
MLKKTLLGLAAAAAITTAALAPSTASAGKLHIKFGFYGGGYSVGYYNPYYGYRRYRRCHYHWKKIWTSYGPKYVKIRHCRRHWY